MEIGKKRWVALFMSMIALCLVLAGCASGGAGGGADAAKSFIGDWKLVGMEEDGEATSSEDIALMEQMGVTVTLSFKEDKSCALSVFGEETSGTWEAKSPSEAAITIEGQTIVATLANEVLTLEDNGTKMMFGKGVPEPSAKAADPGTAAVEESAEESDETAVPIGQTIADDEICTIEVIDKKVDWADDPGYTLKITNKSDKAIRVSAKYDTFSVNGKMAEPELYETVQSGKYVEGFMWFSGDDVDGVDALTNVDLLLK
ncbi:MAG: hypothetical protein SOY95_07995, partial [Atopobiaceae bacterium]|nr:hypothetical protein [Atopobiaceae bacterium]